MLVDVVRFALLGLGAGSVYGLTALGLVVIHRGSGVVNFAHGAIGMVAAYSFYLLRSSGWPTAVAWILALSVAGILGAAFYYLILSRITGAPMLTKIVGTLAVLTLLMSAADRFFGPNPRIVSKLIPTSAIALPGSMSIGTDRVVLLVVALATTAVLSGVYSRSAFGVATAAIAENPGAAEARGLPVHTIAGVNWAAGSALAALSAILIVNVVGLQVATLSLLVIPALAAAVLGRFTSFWLTLAGGMLVGVAESEVAYLQTRFGPSPTIAAWARSIPFLVIVAVLLIRGSAVPLRGVVVERHLRIGNGKLTDAGVAVMVAAPLAMAWFRSDGWSSAIAVTCAHGLIVLSIVVVTGYAGQLSLAQLALAGVAAWVSARLSADHGLPFLLAALLALVITVPVGVLVGLPSLRSRGVDLAVSTLGLALLLQSQIFGNSQRTGGPEGIKAGTPTVLGWTIDPLEHPHRYAAVCCVALMLGAFAVTCVRRGRLGRMFIATRTNERAAQMLGMNVATSKLLAFGIGAALAASGGVLLAFRRPTVTFGDFSAIESVYEVLYAVLGGLGFVLGAAGAVNAPSGVGAFLAAQLGSGWADAFRLVGGLIVLAVILQSPDGLAATWTRWRERLAISIGRQADERSTADGHHERRARSLAQLQDLLMPVRPATSLQLRDVSVNFGSVAALSSVSLDVPPGRVTGLIGPNGAGKSTLIDATCGFVSAKGDVILNGTSITSWSPHARARAGVSRTFQGLELFESLTVAENIAAALPKGRADNGRDARWLVFGGRRHRRPSDVDRIMALTGLEVHGDALPESLSYGNRRLLSLARAVASGASVLLLDEPAAGLDTAERAYLSDLVRRLATDHGVAVLLVEHDVDLVARSCDTVVVLDFGKVIARGAPRDVLADPNVRTSYLGESRHSHNTGPRREQRDEVLRVERLTAGHLQGAAVVHDVSFTLNRGEILALLGPNGAGKSTTLLGITGGAPMAKGTVSLFGTQLQGGVGTRSRRGVVLVPAESATFRTLTVRQNCTVVGLRPDDVFDMFPELRARAAVQAGLLSGGERQMLAVGVALAMQPEVLLIDEMSLGLGPAVVERLLTVLRSTADNGLAVVLVEQHVRQVLEFADRVVVLRQGRIVLGLAASEAAGRIDEISAAYLGVDAPGAQLSTSGTLSDVMMLKNEMKVRKP